MEKVKIGSVAQHFLLTAAARTLSVTAVARMSEEQARALFRALRNAVCHIPRYAALCQ